MKCKHSLEGVAKVNLKCKQKKVVPCDTTVPPGEWNMQLKTGACNMSTDP